MPRNYYLEEDDIGDILVCDPYGKELARFSGEVAIEQAVNWANAHGLELHSNTSPIDLWDHQRLYFRRRPRFLSLGRYRALSQHNDDPPNVKRMIMPDYNNSWDNSSRFEDFFDDDEDIILAPKDVDDEEGDA